MNRFFSFTQFILIISLLIISPSLWANDTVKVGVLLDLQQDKTGSEQMVQYGLDYWVTKQSNRFNKGEKGLFIRLIYPHFSGNPYADTITFKKMAVDSGVRIWIVGQSGEGIFNLIPIAERANAFLFSPSCDSPLLSGISPNFARNRASYEHEADGAARAVAHYFKTHEAAIIYADNDFNLGLENRFSYAFHLEGGQVIAAEAFPEQTDDFIPLLTRIKATAPPCIYLAGTSVGLGKLMVQLRSVVPQTPVVACTKFLTPSVLQTAGSAAEGVVIPVYPTLSSAPKPAKNAFIKGFEKQFSLAPNDLSVNAFEAMDFILKTLTHQKSNQNNTSLWPEKSDYSGIYQRGRLENGDIYSQMNFRVIKNGKSEKLEF